MSILQKTANDNIEVTPASHLNNKIFFRYFYLRKLILIIFTIVPSTNVFFSILRCVTIVNSGRSLSVYKTTFLVTKFIFYFLARIFNA